MQNAEYEPFTDNNFDERLYVIGYEPYLVGARVLKRVYNTDIRGLMNQFAIANKFEITSGYIVNTIANVDRKKTRDVAKCDGCLNSNSTTLSKSI